MILLFDLGDRVIVINHKFNMSRGTITRIIHVRDKSGDRYEYTVLTDPDEFPSTLLILNGHQIQKEMQSH